MNLRPRHFGKDKDAKERVASALTTRVSSKFACSLAFLLFLVPTAESFIICPPACVSSVFSRNGALCVDSRQTRSCSRSISSGTLARKEFVARQIFSPVMTTAYGGTPGSGTKNVQMLSYLPASAIWDGLKVEVGTFKEEEWETGRQLLNLIIFDGLSWPFDKEFDMDAFRGYFLSDAAFVVRCTEDFSEGEGGLMCAKGEILGSFYVKPNFPGRCSHICNGGFITVEKFRGRGIGKLMAASFLKIARDLGYKASYFNLVFANNAASVALWESMGFNRVAVIPKCASLKGVEGLVDAYGYHYDLEGLPADFDIVVAAQTNKKKIVLQEA